MTNIIKKTFVQRLVELISEPNFIKFLHVLSEPNIFKIVGRTHYERWHSCFLGWLLDVNGSHLIGDYALNRLLLLLFDEKTLKANNFEINQLLAILPSIEFSEVQVSPNEFVSKEISIKAVGRFDVFLTTDYKSSAEIGRINIILELKIDSKTDAEQSKKYADWLHDYYPNDINVLVYLVPKLLSDSKATVGDDRWFCLDYQQLNDRLLLPVLDNPNLNEKVRPFISQYIKNLRIRHNGVKMAITNEEKKLAMELYEKYNDVFDSIYDALQEADVIDYSTSDVPEKGRKTGRIAVRIDGKIFEASFVRNLLKKVLKYLVDKGHIVKIPLPWGIGNTRYIVTNEDNPIHPNGRPFFYPETYKGYTIETHYARERAAVVLDKLSKKLEIDFESIEV